MLKFIIISILVIYLIFRVMGFFLRVLFGPLYQQQRQAGTNSQPPTQKRKAPNSNLNIEIEPDQSKRKHKSEFKGGDYVDYEEVK